MSEPNVWLREGEPVLVMGVVTDAHWRDKGLYKIKICASTEGSKDKYIDVWVHDRSLQDISEG